MSVPGWLRVPTPRTGLVLLVVLMAAASAALWTQAVARPFAPLTDPEVPWWALAVMFGVAEVVVLRLQVRQEAQTLSISELPIVIALFLASPADMLLAVILGSGFVYIVVRRQPPLKAAFNLVLRLFSSLVMITIFEAGAGPAAEPGPRDWVAAILAIVVGGIADGLLVLTVIALHDGSVGAREILREVLRAPLTAPLVGCVGLIAVTTAHADPRSGILLVVLFGGLLAGYRAHTSLSDRHLSLTGLYDFGRSVTAAHDVEEVVGSVLAGARELLKAETAELTLLALADGSRDVRYRSSGSAPVSVDTPETDHCTRWESVLGGGGALLLPRRRTAHLQLRPLGHREAVVVGLSEDSRVIGTLLVADRSGQAGTFTPADVQLLETVANQASMALRNGRLVELLRHDAFHDALTGLANRALFREAVDAELSRIQEGASAGCAVMLLDLDGFKEVNDSLGHHTGDALLIHVGRQLTTATVDDAGTVARLGGDEFAVLLGGVADEAAARAAGDRVLQQLRRPVVLDGVDVEVRGSLGIAVDTDGSGEGSAETAGATGSAGSALLRRADEAMYAAKVSGGGLRLHDAAGGGPPRHTQLEFLAELRRGLVNGEVSVYVQPQAGASDRALHAAEALVRWHHPRLGLLTPEEFLPLADRHGLTHDVTELVLDAAIAAAAGWARDGLDLRVSVNISARALIDPRTLPMVSAALTKHALDAQRLTLEITEDAVMSDPERAVATLTALRGLGVRVSIDDFGTGYSSLAYLSRLPVSEVKIDGSFVASLRTGADDLVIVRSIIDLGRNLSLDVVAEGVEDAATWTRLGELGAAAIQGFELARPMPVADFAGWVASYQAGLALPSPSAGVVDVSATPGVPVQGGVRLDVAQPAGAPWGPQSDSSG